MTTDGRTSVVRLRLPFADQAEFVEKYARHGKTSLVLPTRKVCAVGDALRFELLTRDGARLLLAEGRVEATSGTGGRVGLLVRVQRLDPGSRAVFERLRVVGVEEASAAEPGAGEAGEGEAGAAAEAGAAEAGAAEPSAAEPSAAEASAAEASAAEASAGEASAGEASAGEASAGEASAAEAGAAEASAAEPSAAEASAAEATAAEPTATEPTATEPTASPAPAPAPAPARARADRSPVAGIDLGGWQIRAALFTDGIPRTVPLAEEGAAMPAAISVDQAGAVLTGEQALARRTTDPVHTLLGAKWLLGRQLHGPATARERAAAPWRLAAGKDGEVALHVPAGPIPFTSLYAELLAEVRNRLVAAARTDVRRAVLTAPGAFVESQRAALRTAAHRAGFDEVHLIATPLAVALAHGFGKGFAAKRLLVLDHGATAFEAALVTVTGGDRFEVVGTVSEPACGGRVIDARIVKRLREALVDGGGPADLEPGPLARLHVAAEEVKRALSVEERREAHLERIWRDASLSERDLNLLVTRDQLETWSADLVGRCVDVTRDLLAAHGLAPEQLDEALLVGGQSQMPLLRRRMEELLGAPPRDVVEPGAAAALGCAVRGEALRMAGDRLAPALHLREVLGRQVAVGGRDGRLIPVVEPGTPVPCERTFRIATGRPGQTEVEAVFCEGPGASVTEADLVAVFVFGDLPAEPTGESQVRVRVSLDAEGELQICGFQEDTGRELPVERIPDPDPETLQMRLAHAESVIHDLEVPPATGASDGREGGFLHGLRRRLFGKV